MPKSNAMITVLFRRFYLPGCLLFICAFAAAQAPVFNSATPNTATIARFEKFELNIDLIAGYSNPYDYNDISVQAIFTTPSGRKDTIDGFFMQDFTVGTDGFASPVGNGNFKVRYAPAEMGTYTYILSCKNSLGTAAMPEQSFQAQGSSTPGFIRKNETNYLSFDNGSQYIPIGENMGWQSNNVVKNYTDWVTDLAGNGGNFIRVWMSSWAFAIEWKNVYNGDQFEGLKKYKQSSAFYLDWLLDFCKQKNVYMMLALNHHGQVSTNVNPNWNDNPYNAANGGPAVNTWDFFTNTTARDLHKNRLRYIIARYGYSPNIQSWELFNELHWTNDFEAHKSELTSWDDEMSTYIKSKDVHKHLVTTSYGGTEIITDTWNLANIDFTQTHFYNNSPNIETILGAANQSFLTQYGKPTLNGEFGLGADGPVLSADDPNGVHIHNAIWGSMFSGSLGPAMTWWWDNYIEPKNLYYHFQPLSDVAALIDFTGDNYKKITSSTAGGGTSDLTISPGGGFEKAAASAFTIDAAGAITPGSSSMSSFIFGSTYNTQLRNPPTFTVNYPVAGEFKVVTAGVANDAPKITLYLDEVQVLNADAAANTTYSINVPAGAHTIKVDNLGIDWAQVSNYVFTNIGSPLSTYVLKNAAGNKATGYVLSNKYNWQYLKANGNTAPPPVQGSTITVPGLQNGSYTVRFYSTSSGDLLSSSTVPVTGGQLTMPLPDIAWDVAFTAEENAVLPLQVHYFHGEKVKDKNHLHFSIGEAQNVKEIFIERSAGGSDFQTLKMLDIQGPALSGTHTFIDDLPVKGNNFYRLRIVDNDGSERFSAIIKLVNNLLKYSVKPNPFTDHLNLQIDPGKYRIQLTDQNGRIVFNRKVVSAANAQELKVYPGNLSSGIYILRVFDESGTLVGAMNIKK